MDAALARCRGSILGFVAAVEHAGFYVDDAAGAVRRCDMCNVIDIETGWKADLIVRKDRPFSREEFARRLPAVIGGVDLFGATAEDTILAKLERRKDSGSEQQLRDVIGVLTTQDVDRNYLTRWAAELGVTNSLREALIAAGRA